MMSSRSGVAWVVLVVRGHVDRFIVFDVRGGSDNVESVNHRGDLGIRTVSVGHVPVYIPR
jgi:hypothetical protein